VKPREWWIDFTVPNISNQMHVLTQNLNERLNQVEQKLLR
jgi:hypothetical protein